MSKSSCTALACPHVHVLENRQHGTCLWFLPVVLFVSTSALNLGPPEQALAPFHNMNHPAAFPDWISPISHSSLGVINQRWWSWRTNELPEAWVDACFMSVTQGLVLPPKVLVEIWKNTPCRCGKWMPSKSERFSVIVDLPAVTAWSHDEVTYRTKTINGLLRDIVPQMGPGAQVVNLGAGFDGRMFALKFLQNATLFEMDLKDTLDLKSVLVQRCGLHAVNGKNVHYLPLDLEDNNVYKKLSEDKAFDPDKPTVFVSEAVAQYINEKAFMHSLQKISELSRNENSRLILMSWQSMYPFPISSIVGDEIKFMVPSDGQDVKWFRRAGWEMSLTPSQREHKDFYDRRHIPYNYINVFKPIKRDKIL